jgi:phosphoglycolate phosphatase-like HAD superfamily hydrolase
MIGLLIFDWDDVFTLGSKEGYVRCLHETLTNIGVHLKPAEEHRRILQTWGKSHQEELRVLLQERPELLAEACKVYEDKFFGGLFVSGLSYIEGANKLLEQLNKNYVLAVATGAHPDILKNQVMPKFKVPDVFAQIISSYDLEDVEKQKPHPYMLETIMKKQGYSQGQTLFIGDAKSDVQMARSAGVEPVVVLTGHLNREEAKKLQVRYIINAVTDLPAFLDDEIN